MSVVKRIACRPMRICHQPAETKIRANKLKNVWCISQKSYSDFFLSDSNPKYSDATTNQRTTRDECEEKVKKNLEVRHRFHIGADMKQVGRLSVKRLIISFSPFARFFLIFKSTALMKWRYSRSGTSPLHSSITFGMIGCRWKQIKMNSIGALFID